MLKSNILKYLKNKFPQAAISAELLSPYFEKINFDPSKGLEKPQLNKLFTLLMDDYLSFRMDPDQLAELLEKIYMLIQNNKKLTQTEIGSNLIYFAELEILLRTNFKAAERTLEEMLRLYQSLKK